MDRKGTRSKCIEEINIDRDLPNKHSLNFLYEKLYFLLYSLIYTCTFSKSKIFFTKSIFSHHVLGFCTITYCNYFIPLQAISINKIQVLPDQVLQPPSMQFSAFHNKYLHRFLQHLRA